MRLKTNEIKSIIDAVNLVTQDKTYELYLYGSRVKDTSRGGDIDLLLLIELEKYEFFLENKYKIIAAIKKAIGDQKIDLVVAHKEQLSSDAFTKAIFKEAVKINNI